MWLLEVNADPSLAVFGDRLRPLCAQLIRDTLDAALPGVTGDGGGCGDVDEVRGFKLVLELPPRFEDGAEGRRRVAKLMSLMGSLAASTYDEQGNGGNGGRATVGDCTGDPVLLADGRKGELRGRGRGGDYDASAGGGEGEGERDGKGGSGHDDGDNVASEGEGEEEGEGATVVGARGRRMMVSVSLGTPGSAGAADALRRAVCADSGAPLWEVTYNPKAPLCTLQWAPHRVIRWERVMDQQQRQQERRQLQPLTDNSLLVANHYYSRAGLLRRVELSTTLASAGVTGVGCARELFF